MANIKMQRGCEIVLDGIEIFVVLDGRRIAKRGDPDRPQSATWVALEPGWAVRGRGVEKIEITYEPPAAQREPIAPMKDGASE